MGIAHVPECRHVFPQMTVLENLEMGAYLVKSIKEMKNNLELVFEYFPRLKERIQQFDGTMSGGEQQMVTMAIGLISSPRLILMDEPSLGLSTIMHQ